MPKRTIIRACDGIVICGVIVSALIMPVERHYEGLKNVAVFLPFGCFLLKMAVSRQVLFRRTPLDFLIAFYLLACLIAALFSIDVSESFRYLRKELLPCLIMYYLIVNHFESEKLIKWLVAALAVGLLAILLWSTAGWFELVAGEALDEGWRLQGSFRQPNRYAQYLLVMGSLSVALLAMARDWRYKALIGAMLLLAGLNLFWTYSRAGWIAFFPTMLIFLLHAGKKQLALALVGCALLVLVVMATPQGQERLSTSWKVDERHLIYPSALNAFKDHFWFGVGYGDEVYQEAYSNTYKSPEAQVDHSGAHNIFLQVAVETGALGLLAFILLHLRIAWLAIKAYGRQKANEWKWIALWGLSSLVAVFTIGQLHTLYRDRNIGIFWFVVAIVAAVHQLAVKQQEAPADAPPDAPSEAKLKD